MQHTDVYDTVYEIKLIITSVPRVFSSIHHLLPLSFFFFYCYFLSFSLLLKLAFMSSLIYSSNITYTVLSSKPLFHVCLLTTCCCGWVWG